MTERLFAFGSNFRLLDTDLRSRFVMNYDAFQGLSSTISRSDYFILNTCNRSEVYGVGNVEDVKAKLFDVFGITKEEQKYFFAYQGEKALEHIFSVACGLNSQIVGDNEITGQFRTSYMEAKESNHLNGLLEKMANLCLQAAKSIKTNTDLSNGTKSVSYAATKHILNSARNQHPNILLVGCGSIGRSVAKNIKEYIPQAQLTLCNRTNPKALLLAEEIGANYIPFESLAENVAQHEIIVSCVNMNGKKLFRADFSWPKHNIRIIDLAVPTSVEQDVLHLEHITVDNVDKISKELLKTFDKRNLAIPQAKQIMQAHIAEFVNWTKVYDNKEVILQWQEKFELASHKCPFMKELDEPERLSLKNRSTAALVSFIRTETEISKANLIDEYQSDTLQSNASCNTVHDCVKNKLNCFTCNTSN